MKKLFVLFIAVVIAVTTPLITAAEKPATPKPPDAEGIDIYGYYYKYVDYVIYIWYEPIPPLWDTWQWRESGNGSATYTIFPFWSEAWGETRSPSIL